MQKRACITAGSCPSTVALTYIWASASSPTIITVATIPANGCESNILIHLLTYE